MEDFQENVREERDQLGRLRQDVHVLVRDLGRDGRSRLIRLVLGAHALARSATGLTVAGHVRSRGGWDLVALKELRESFLVVMLVVIVCPWMKSRTGIAVL
jgi:hypothetical protein